MDSFPEADLPRRVPSPVVHLELHTANLARACAFYAEVCGWRVERIAGGPRPYHALGWDGALAGGVVECDTHRPLWLPYVEVRDVEAAVARSRRSGAQVVLEPREGPAGWRGVVRVPDGGELAFWRPKPAG